MRHKTNIVLQSFQVFLRRILELPFGRRLIFFSALSSLIFLFFPWFYEGTASFSAFGKTFIFASIILFLNIFSLLIVLREVFSHEGFLGKFRHSDLLMFAFGQSLFTVVLANASLSTLLLEKPEYVLSSMGMMMTFVALGVGLAGVFFSHDFVPESGEKKQVFVDKDVDLSDSKMNAESDLSLGDYEQQ